MVFHYLMYLTMMVFSTQVQKVPYLGALDSDIQGDPFSILKEEGTPFFVSCVNWSAFPHRPDVVVYAGYTDEMLWLSFNVKNDYTRVYAIHDQDPAFEDSCVEFFMATNDGYRNFEFNCLGVCLSSVGIDRHSRTKIPVHELNRIIRIPSFSKENLPQKGELCDWKLTVGIPFSILGIQNGNILYGNFYKCGAKTKVLHYLSWAPIITEKPNFHCPEFFQAIYLQ